MSHLTPILMNFFYYDPPLFSDKHRTYQINIISAKYYVFCLFIYSSSMDVSNLHKFMSFIPAQKNVFTFFVDFHIIYILLHTFYIEYNNDTIFFQKIFKRRQTFLFMKFKTKNMFLSSHYLKKYEFKF